MGYQKIYYCAITEVTLEKKDKKEMEDSDNKKKISWGLKNFKLNIGMKYYKDHIFNSKRKSVQLKLESNQKSKDLDRLNMKVIINRNPKF